MKKIIIVTALMVTTFFTSGGAFAEQKVGVVDMSKILSNCSKAQEITSNISHEQTEVQKMVADARKQVNAAKTDKEKEALEKKLSDEIELKNNLFKADYEKSVQALQESIVSTVKKVADSKKIDFIFKKDNIVTGGQDITDDVLAELNK